MTIRITPSILSADFVNLQRDIERVSSCDAVHVDVMDNHFVPNLTIGLPVVEAILGCTDLPADVHLMIEDPDRWAPAYAEAGVQTVTFHGEAAKAPIRLARELRRLGARAGLVLKPATPIDPWADVLEEFDNVLLADAYDKWGIEQPWQFRGNQSLRTAVWMGRKLLDIDPKYDLQFEGIQHHALHDARHEAKYLLHIMGAFKKAIAGEDS